MTSRSPNSPRAAPPPRKRPRLITTRDIPSACGVLRPVYDATCGTDGQVTLEVDPRIARDPARTVAEARDLWRMVNRPNLLIKIPATAEGLPAITRCLAQGISVNVTLIFGLGRYGEVIDAFERDIARLSAAGVPVQVRRGPGVGCRLDVPRQLPPVTLTPGEAAALIASFAAVGPYTSATARTALQKLLGALASPWSSGSATCDHASMHSVECKARLVLEP